jgi:hypothetical protein
VSESRETGVCAAVVRSEDIIAHVWVVCGGGKRGSDAQDGEQTQNCENRGDSEKHDEVFSV